MIRNTLRAVPPVSDSQVAIDDREGVAVDRKVLVEAQTFFLRREIRRTKETRTFSHRFLIDRRRRANQTMGNMTHEYVEPVDPYPARLCLRQTIKTVRQLRPGAPLPIE